MTRKRCPGRCRAMGHRTKIEARAGREKKAARDRNWREALGLAEAAERRARRRAEVAWMRRAAELLRGRNSRWWGGRLGSRAEWRQRVCKERGRAPCGGHGGVCRRVGD